MVYHLSTYVNKKFKLNVFIGTIYSVYVLLGLFGHRDAWALASLHQSVAEVQVLQCVCVWVGQFVHISCPYVRL